MNNLRITAVALAVAAGLAASGAQASDDISNRAADMPPQSEWMSVSELAQKLESQGYTVREIDTGHGVYEVEMTDANGMRVEAYLHPVTGEPVQRLSNDD